MDEYFLDVGTRIEFYQDGLRGTGTIKKLMQNDQYCYHVQVDWYDKKGSDDILHDCLGTFSGNFGWLVEHGNVTAVLDCEGDASCDVEDSDLDAILGM